MTRTPFGFFAWVLCSGLVFLQGCNGAYVVEPPSTNIEEVGPSWDEIAAQVPLGPGRRYSDEELGLYDLIDQVVFYRPYFARGRTIDEFRGLADRC